MVLVLCILALGVMSLVPASASDADLESPALMLMDDMHNLTDPVPR